MHAGRVFSALLKLTNYSMTIYSPENLGWYLVTGHEVVGVSMFSRLNKSLGVIGLIGLDRILSFKVCVCVCVCVRACVRACKSEG